MITLRQGPNGHLFANIPRRIYEIKCPLTTSQHYMNSSWSRFMTHMTMGPDLWRIWQWVQIYDAYDNGSRFMTHMTMQVLGGLTWPLLLLACYDFQDFSGLPLCLLIMSHRFFVRVIKQCSSMFKCTSTNSINNTYRLLKAFVSHLRIWSLFVCKWFDGEKV